MKRELQLSPAAVAQKKIEYAVEALQKASGYLHGNVDAALSDSHAPNYVEAESWLSLAQKGIANALTKLSPKADEQEKAIGEAEMARGYEVIK